MRNDSHYLRTMSEAPTKKLKVDHFHSSLHESLALIKTYFKDISKHFDNNGNNNYVSGKTRLNLGWVERELNGVRDQMKEIRDSLEGKYNKQ